MFTEFKGFYSSIFKKQLSEDEFNNIYLKNYSSHENGITEKGFYQIFKDIYLNEGEEKIKEILNNLGYDKDLYSLRSRNFMITFHSNNEIIINVRDNLGTDLNSKINKITFNHNSNEILKEGDISVIQYQNKGCDIISFGCFNHSNDNLNVTLSFDNENNGIIIGGNVNVIQKIIQPNSYEFFANVFCLSNSNISNIKFNLNYTLAE